MIWAIFLCVASLHQCSMYEAGGLTYASRPACERQLSLYDRGRQRGDGVSFRCMSHRADWQ